MATLIEQWSDLSMQLIAAAADYAKSGEFSEEADQNIRTVRIMSNILLVAANQAAIPRPPAPPA